MKDHYRRAETERLILRELREEDASDLFEVCSDALVTRYLSYPTHQSIDDTLWWIRSCIKENIVDHMPLPYVIVLKSNNKAIGTINYVKMTSYGAAEIGYQLGSAYWNQGIMSEALSKLIEESFTYMEIQRLSIMHMCDNIGSQRVIEKNGFIKEGLLKKYAFNPATGALADVKIYRLLKEEWEKENEGTGN